MRVTPWLTAAAGCGPILAASMFFQHCAAADASAPAVYSAAQAQVGMGVYARYCASCHGAALEGQTGPALKGVAFKQLAVAQQLTADSLLSVIVESMPQSAPASLSADQYAAVTAYVLQVGGYPAGPQPLAAGDPKLSTLSLGK